jgi:hypothetical protein
MYTAASLKKLGLDYVRLERQSREHYAYHAWNGPKLTDNGLSPVPNADGSKREFPANPRV